MAPHGRLDNLAEMHFARMGTKVGFHRIAPAGQSNYPRRVNVSAEEAVVTKDKSIVAIYPTHTAAEAAIKELQRSGFDLRKLSIVGRDFHTDEQVVGYYNAGDRMKAWGQTGAFWGGMWGLLFGSAFFWVPSVGPLLVAGPVVSWIVGALEGALVVGGLSAIGAGLYGLGIPRNSILQYETAITSGKYVLIVHGTLEETTKAKAILSRTIPETLHHHQ